MSHADLVHVESVVAHDGDAAFPDVLHHPRQVPVVGLVGAAQEAGLPLHLDVDVEEPEGRQNARSLGNKASFHAEHGDHCPGVQWTGAAESHEGEPAGIVAPLDGDEPVLFRHLDVQDAMCPERYLHR